MKKVNLILGFILAMNVSMNCYASQENKKEIIKAQVIGLRSNALNIYGGNIPNKDLTNELIAAEGVKSLFGPINEKISTQMAKLNVDIDDNLITWNGINYKVLGINKKVIIQITGLNQSICKKLLDVICK